MLTCWHKRLQRVNVLKLTKANATLTVIMLTLTVVTATLSFNVLPLTLATAMLNVNVLPLKVATATVSFNVLPLTLNVNVLPFFLPNGVVHKPVCVRPDRKPLVPVFSHRGSNVKWYSFIIRDCMS